jgi:hypothetical protein
MSNLLKAVIIGAGAGRQPTSHDPGYDPHQIQWMPNVSEITENLNLVDQNVDLANHFEQLDLGLNDDNQDSLDHIHGTNSDVHATKTAGGNLNEEYCAAGNLNESEGRKERIKGANNCRRANETSNILKRTSSVVSDGASNVLNETGNVLNETSNVLHKSRGGNLGNQSINTAYSTGHQNSSFGNQVNQMHTNQIHTEAVTEHKTHQAANSGNSTSATTNRNKSINKEETNDKTQREQSHRMTKKKKKITENKEDLDPEDLDPEVLAEEFAAELCKNMDPKEKNGKGKSLKKACEAYGRCLVKENVHEEHGTTMSGPSGKEKKEEKQARVEKDFDYSNLSLSINDMGLT